MLFGAVQAQASCPWPLFASTDTCDADTVQANQQLVLAVMFGGLAIVGTVLWKCTSSEPAPAIAQCSIPRQATHASKSTVVSQRPSLTPVREESPWQPKIKKSQTKQRPSLRKKQDAVLALLTTKPQKNLN